MIYGLRVGLPVRTVLCTPTAIHDVVNKFYTKEAAAAELASGAANVAPSKKSAGKTDDRPLTADELEERKTKRRNMAIVSFNFAFMLVMGGLSLGTSLGIFIRVLAAIAAGVVAAGIAWVTAK